MFGSSLNYVGELRQRISDSSSPIPDGEEPNVFHVIAVESPSHIWSNDHYYIYRKIKKLFI